MMTDQRFISVTHAILVLQAADLGGRRMMEAVKYLRENWTGCGDVEDFIRSVQEKKASERF